MNSHKFYTKIIFSLLAVTLIPLKADDKIAKEKLEIAEKLYAERNQAEKLDQGIEAAKEAEKEATDKDLKFDSAILHAKFLYFKGNHAKTDKEKQTHLLSALETAKAARTNGDYAESYFWEAASLSRWAKSVGVATSVKRKGELLKLLETANKKKTREGKDGETFEGHGTSRILGKVYYELPSAFGGNYDTAIKALKKAYEKAPEYASNIAYYAEARYSFKSDNKDKTKKAEEEANARAEAKKILDGLLEKDPLTYNAKRIPETQDEFAEAKKIRSTMK